MLNLVSVVGHDTGVLKHMINHYKDTVDNIFIVAYTTPGDNSIVEKIEECGISPYRIVEKPKFHWEEVTKLYNDIKLEKPNDWWVVSDVDELQLYPRPIYELIEECENKDYKFITGGFLDRIGNNGIFPEITNEDIWNTFPMGGFFRYPLSKACPNKVCLMKGDIEVTSGQHYAKIDGKIIWGVEGTKHPQRFPIEECFVQTHHFKWDKSCIDRLKNVSDEKEEYTFWREYGKMYNRVKRKQKIDVTDKNFMIEKVFRNFNDYKQWPILTQKIIRI
jgi:hypothetical protein